MCSSDSAGRDSTLDLDPKSKRLICTKIEVALEQNSVKNGVSKIFAVLELLAVKACYFVSSC